MSSMIPYGVIWNVSVKTLIKSSSLHQLNWKRIFQFLEEVNSTMPDIGDRTKIEFYENDRYDYGLWCDSMTKGKILTLNETNSSIFVGGTSKYDRFLLINDSMMALEKTNKLLDELDARNASFISLSYWGDKKDPNAKFWLESPVRAFSLKGIQIYADTVCFFPCEHFRRYCGKIFNTSHGFLKIQKRCIVEKTEIAIIHQYQLDEVHGLYPSNDGTNRSWSNNFNFW